MTYLILDDKIINFNKINYIYIEENDIMNTYNNNNNDIIYSIMVSVAKENISIFTSEDEAEVKQKFKKIIFNLKDSQKIYLD